MNESQNSIVTENIMSAMLIAGIESILRKAEEGEIASPNAVEKIKDLVMSYSPKSK